MFVIYILIILYLTNLTFRGQDSALEELDIKGKKSKMLLLLHSFMEIGNSKQKYGLKNKWAIED